MRFFKFYKPIVDMGSLVLCDGIPSVSFLAFFDGQPLGGKMMISARRRAKRSRGKFSPCLFQSHCFELRNDSFIACIQCHLVAPKK